jgi:hypothetical protein
VMVLVFSSHANASPQIRREVERAVNAETVLIPFRIEDVAPAEALEFFLGTPHWLDALTPPLEAHLERLTAAVASFVTVAEPPHTTAEAALRSNPTDATPSSARPAQSEAISVGSISKPLSTGPQHAPNSDANAKNRLAFWSLVVSLIGIPSSAFIVGYALGIAGIAMGVVALKQIKVSHEAGRRRAIAGIVLGAAALVVMPTVLLIRFLVLHSS